MRSRKKHKTDGAAAGPEQTADRAAGQDAENNDRAAEKNSDRNTEKNGDKGVEKNGGKNGDKSAGKKHRRHRSRRFGENREGDGQKAAQTSDARKNTSEMKIYADRGTQGD